MILQNKCDVHPFSSRACELGTKSCVVQHKENIMIECKCGKKWWIDYTPTPDGCENDTWRIWLGDEPGQWMDVDGNLVKD